MAPVPFLLCYFYRCHFYTKSYLFYEKKRSRRITLFVQDSKYFLYIEQNTVWFDNLD